MGIDQNSFYPEPEKEVNTSISGYISKFFKAPSKPKKEQQHQLNIIGQLQNAAEVQTELNLDIMRSRKDTIDEPPNMRPTNVTYSQ